MFSLFAVSSILVVVSSVPQEIPTAEEGKAGLMASNLSDGVATEIIAVGKQNYGLLEAAKGDIEATKAAFAVITSKIGAYIKTQSQADQDAWAVFKEKKMNEIQARKAFLKEATAV